MINKQPICRWAIEFQCVEELEHAAFVGVNFYSRSNVGETAEENFNEMLTVSQHLGIDQYWNTTAAGLRRVDHTGCLY